MSFISITRLKGKCEMTIGNEDDALAKGRTKSLLVYGKTKIGKTLDVCYTFSKAFVLLSEPGGLDSVETHLGFIPKHHLLVDLDDPFGEAKRVFTQTVLPGVVKKEISSIFIDTGTELSDRMASAAQKSVGQDPRKWSPLVQRQMKELLRMALVSNAWFVMSAHERPPSAEDHVVGGPALTGALANTVPAMFSLILHAVVKPSMKGYARYYECDSLDPLWITGDRWGACENSQPMELSVIMWKALHPDQEVPEKLLKGKPIRYGGKLYKPGELVTSLPSAADEVLDSIG